ncbi:MAG: hypothetical protein O7G85_02630, partial [Planctomycetota bacterium]|nr:hypothetical protein [Planctomycetota bacterium]
MFNAFSFAKVAALLICIFLTSVRTSHGQLDCACFDRVQPGGIGAGDVFGHSAHINGDYAVIGAPGKGPGTKPGTAFVYKLEGENWVLQAQLLASDGNANDYFGASVTISGDLIAVGAILADPYGKNSGAVYVFRRFGSIWTEEAKLEPNPNSEEPVVSHDAFGNSVAISGSMVLVGTPGHNTNGPNTGSVLVFQPVLGLWSEVQRIEPANFQAGADFGYKITTSGTTAFISAYGHDSFSNTDNGIVFVYAFTGGTWIQTAQITGLINGARFGVDLDVDNNKLIVGTIGDGAYIFTPGVGGIWQESAHLVPPGPSSTALGHSVAISDDIDGTVAFVGDYAFDVLDTDPSCVAPTPEGQSRPDHLGAGAVYTFASCTGQWIHTNTDVSDVVSLNGLWGVSIAAENGRIVIGDWDFGNGLIGGASFGYIDSDGDGLPDL